jgi:hypothetical protein
MSTVSSLSQQLADLGIHLPVWPEEPEVDVTTCDWIQRGQAYVERMRLWRAQLRSAAAIEGPATERLISSVLDVGRQSAWDQSVTRYLLSDLNGNSQYQRVQAAAKLATAADRTAAQRLCAALELAQDGFLVCSLDAIRHLVELPQVNEQECLELCALLVVNLHSPTLSAVESHSGEHVYSWLQNVTLQLQVTSVLAAAIRTACGVQNRAEIINQLDLLMKFAADGRKGIAGDEFDAISCVKARELRKQSYVQGKPLLRTIHHFACTGGTVISKCLASMPDVALISEVNPFCRLYGSEFDPTNPLLLLERSYRTLSTDEIIEEFSRQVSHVYQICLHDDVDLILRDHSHTDFCMGSNPSPVSPIADYLASSYELLSVVTVRHPLDSYLGLLAQGWEKQFSPSSLNEYCRRYLLFLNRYASLPVFRYEDFCARPDAFVKNLCDVMRICFSAGFQERLGNVALSGDSGRAGIDSIELRSRRELPEHVQAEIESSSNYSELLARLGY